MEEEDTVQTEYEKGYDTEEGSLASYVTGQFYKAKTARRVDEERWLRAYQNFRGLYGADVKFTETEKSNIFVKVTKTKCLASYGQVGEVLFGANKFPIGIEQTKIPDGVADSVHLDIQPTPQTPEAAEDPTLKPGETMQELRDRLGPLKDKLAPMGDQIKEGPGTTQTQVTFNPGEVAAAKMEKTIHDQLEESTALKHLRKTVMEAVMLGTGVFKGPFVETKEYPQWKDGEYSPLMKDVPKVSSVSLWNYYPDHDADCQEEAEFGIERHKLSRSKLRALKKRPNFKKDTIDSILGEQPNYTEEWWETHIDDDKVTVATDRYEVLEFWGFVDKSILKTYDVDVPKGLSDQETLHLNVWVCGDKVLRAVLNPFTPQFIPYYVVPYEVNPYSFFGVGVAENMDDTQTLMNGFMRMAVDNAALSGNMIIEIDETNLVPGQDLTLYPGKVFRRQGGAPGQSIFGTKFPNVSNENMQMFDKARQLADESTGLPSFAHGQTGVSGVGRTSSGISMLMSAANGSIRTVIKNFDDYLLAPLGKALFHWNMQFNPDEEIKGDLAVKARATDSLMANEVRSQRLLQFLSVVQNPVLSPFAKMDYIIREIAVSMDLDPDKVTNSLPDAAIQAKLMEQFKGPEGQGQGQTPQGEGPPSPDDPTGAGGGNIGVGSAPGPQEQGFSGNEPQIAN